MKKKTTFFHFQLFLAIYNSEPFRVFAWHITYNSPLVQSPITFQENLKSQRQQHFLPSADKKQFLCQDIYVLEQ